MAARMKALLADTLFKRLFALMWLALVISHAVAFLVRAAERLLQVFINLSKKNLECDPFLAALGVAACLRIHLHGRDVGNGAAGGLIALVLKVIMSGVGGDLLHVSQDGVGMLNGEIAKQTAVVLPEFDVRNLHEVFNQRNRSPAP